MNIKELLQRGYELQLERIEIEDQLEPLIEKYLIHQTEYFESIEKIIFERNSLWIYYTTRCWGNTDYETATIGWDYFDDPTSYLAQEKERRRQEKEETLKKIEEEKENRDREIYEKMKLRFEG